MECSKPPPNITPPGCYIWSLEMAPRGGVLYLGGVIFGGCYIWGGVLYLGGVIFGGGLVGSEFQPLGGPTPKSACLELHPLAIFSHHLIMSQISSRLNFLLFFPLFFG